MVLNVKTSLKDVSGQVTPGGIIKGTVELESREPLHLTELTVRLSGRATTRIFRELSIIIMPIQQRWKAEVTLCDRRLILVDTLTTLPPGVHKFTFHFRVPATIEIPPETDAERGRKKEWLLATPFVGFQTSHPLPPTVEVKSEQDKPFGYGKASALIEYHISASGKANYQNGQSFLPPPTKIVSVAGPSMELVEEIQPRKLGLLLSGRKHQGVEVSVEIPGTVTQWEPFPVRIGIEGAGFALVSLKIKLHTLYAVRGRSTLWKKERVDAARSEDKLLAWEGKKELPPGEPQLVESAPVSCKAAVVNFATLNVACVAHQLEVKFKLQDSEGKVIPGLIGPVPFEIQGPKLSAAGEGDESPRASMSVSEYCQWVSEKPK
ncbi:uncharacterized protein BJX67DRAFT_383025 [Aspergillus lucknowensis]|uniref:Arrestin-like N-terminal domain-containing protein n=1 Tax=Aspergillus lucknowensis TaxID=176173 RepID=A0ABR4LL56_9EURO